MGCVSSKQAVSVTPAIDHSGAFGRIVAVESDRKRGESGRASQSEVGKSGRASSNGVGGCESLSFRLGNIHKYVQGEHVAAGWPAWLSAVAGEAIHGWVPLRADAFEKLEKVQFIITLSSLC